MKHVTQDEFEHFITTYPRVLDRNVAMMAEPPVVTFNDFTLGKWPASIVARHTFDGREARVPSGWAVKEAP
jgi:hypothetical protein